MVRRHITAHALRPEQWLTAADSCKNIADPAAECCYFVADKSLFSAVPAAVFSAKWQVFQMVREMRRILVSASAPERRAPAGSGTINLDLVRLAQQPRAGA